MEMNLNENTIRNQDIKNEINAILETWRGIYSKEHTSIVEEIKKYTRRKPFMSANEYGIWCLCKVEGKEAFRTVYNEYKKPFEKDEFVCIQKNAFMNRLENDCRKLTWHLSELTPGEKTAEHVTEVLHRINNLAEFIEGALEAAWEEHKMAFTFTPFYEVKKEVEVYEFDYEPVGNIAASIACCVMGIKTYEYDISGAVHALEVSMEEMPAEADRIAIKAVDSILTRKIVEPIRFALSVM